MTGAGWGSGAVLAILLTVLPVAAQDSFEGGPETQPPDPAQYPSSRPPSTGKTAHGASPQHRPYEDAETTNLRALMDEERQDFGVPPTRELHTGPMHGPTPNTIPGGQVITTKGLVSLLEGRQTPYRLFDVLGEPVTLPGAINAVAAHQGGSFDDHTQRQFSRFLQAVTGGNKQIPLIFFCLSPRCWMSYNASLRAIHLGYTNVLWYRGGIEAWRAAGRAVQPAASDYAQ